MKWDKLEEEINASELVRFGTVIDRDKPYLAALIVPDRDALCRRLERDGVAMDAEAQSGVFLAHLETRRYYCTLLHEANRLTNIAIDRFALVEADDVPGKHADSSERAAYSRRLCARHAEVIASFYLEIPPGVG